jgi:hypothetical protein
VILYHPIQRLKKRSAAAGPVCWAAHRNCADVVTLVLISAPMANAVVMDHRLEVAASAANPPQQKIFSSELFLFINYIIYILYIHILL